MFIQSQVDKVGGLQLVQKDASGQSRIVHYAGEETPNKPVNVMRFDTIYKKSLQDVEVELPCIFFDNENGRIVWRYPPTTEGETQRDMDYSFIMDNFGERCPRDFGPSVIR